MSLPAGEECFSELTFPYARIYRLAVYAASMTEAPMREPTFLILTALAEQPQHGYGVIADVARISDGRVRLRAGTLYAALDRLRTEGLVEVDLSACCSSAAPWSRGYCRSGRT